jgi:lactoylglutathione lyase
MKLSKDYIDVGLQTNLLDPMLDFWQQDVGLPYEELLKVGGGTHQHRHSLNGSVFKLNNLRDPLPEGNPTGYRELFIAREDVDEPVQLSDPDGNLVSLVPPGHMGITNIGMRMEVSSIKTFSDWYRNVLEIEQVDERTFKWATTLFFLDEDPTRGPTEGMRGIGYRYITVQVWKADEEQASFVERGGDEARAPITSGSTARFGFIRDPDANWIEVSQRASLTGSLEP